MPRKFVESMEEAAGAFILAWLLVAAILGTLVGGSIWIAWRHW